MPRVGGIALMLSYLGALGLALLVAPQAFPSSLRHSALMLSLLPASGLIFLTGLIDDLMTLRPWQKLFGQALAAGLAVLLGAHLSLQHVPSWLGMAISFLWLLVCTNAFNLIDGIDGLAAGVALFASASTLAAAIFSGDLGLAVATVPLAGCLFAFLRYNFHPASIFLGDCGSLTIGFMLGCFGLSWSQHAGTMFGLCAPLVAFALPLLDLFLAVGRRFLRGAPLFEGDRHHIHHKVLARSMTTRRTVVILYGACCTASILALLISFSQSRYQWIAIFLFCGLVLASMKSLRYTEFTVAIQMISRRSILRFLKEEIYLGELEGALAKADTVEAIWDVACMACEDLQFATIRMQLQERSFFIAIETEQSDLAWAVRIPLGLNGELTLTRARKDGQFRLMLAVLHCLQTSILEKNFASGSNQASRPAFSYQGAA
jgi:UDP-GlcNAc:undecaprenyl-phosphate GlcNAc-1-phosphate transferase